MIEQRKISYSLKWRFNQTSSQETDWEVQRVASMEKIHRFKKLLYGLGVNYAKVNEWHLMRGGELDPWRAKNM